jgi:hypothetical protein
MAAQRGASSRCVVVHWTLQFFSHHCFCARASPEQCSLAFVRWRQELEIRARERYGALDQMSSELRWLQEQRDALDALVEALRMNDGWLAYRAEALQDQLLELEGQSTEGGLHRREGAHSACGPG